jgi:hypothetical protein
MQDKNQDQNEEINYEKIIAQGREFIADKGEFRKGEYFINLALLSHNIVESSKINCIGIKSFLNLKLLNEHFITIIVKKYYSYFKEKKHKTFSSDTLTSIVKGFYRGGLMLFDSKKYFLSAFCLYKAKQILIEQRMKVDEALESKISQVMKTIFVIVNNK